MRYYQPCFWHDFVLNNLEHEFDLFSCGCKRWPLPLRINYGSHTLAVYVCYCVALNTQWQRQAPRLERGHELK